MEILNNGAFIIYNGTQHISAPSENAPVTTVQCYYVEFEPPTHRKTHETVEVPEKSDLQSFFLSIIAI